MTTSTSSRPATAAPCPRASVPRDALREELYNGLQRVLLAVHQVRRYGAEQYAPALTRLEYEGCRDDLQAPQSQKGDIFLNLKSNTSNK